ncbi:hypothetical protein TcasGA2_TC034264 [Tribolium castaneum]|uniref:Uncharacterized protein n=1 Tax=Tribolium castaneum TaxID=7070 RepID=A0A139WCH1_TRICA|nr:hypothetical protein TcasGA2_TC034264 [Tribolium castaneum]
MNTNQTFSFQALTNKQPDTILINCSWVKKYTRYTYYNTY